MSPTGVSYSLSVVMPCLNEESNLGQTIPAVLKTLDAFGVPGEIVVVDDGSKDATTSIAEEWTSRDSRVKLARHATPQGIGAAFWKGVQTSRMDYVTMIPGDNENSPEEVLAYFYLTRDVDIIVPFVYNVEVRSKSQRLLSTFYRFIINFSFGTNLNYTNGTVIYNARVLKELDLHSKGFFYQTELLVRLIRSGYLYAEVPCFLKERKDGQTKALSWKSLRILMLGYLKLLWDVHVIRKFGLTNTQLSKYSATYRRVSNSPRG